MVRKGVVFHTCILLVMVMNNVPYAPVGHRMVNKSLQQCYGRPSTHHYTRKACTRQRTALRRRRRGLPRRRGTGRIRNVSSSTSALLQRGRDSASAPGKRSDTNCCLSVYRIQSSTGHRRGVQNARMVSRDVDQTQQARTSHLERFQVSCQRVRGMSTS